MRTPPAAPQLIIVSPQLPHSQLCLFCHSQPNQHPLSVPRLSLLAPMLSFIMSSNLSFIVLKPDLPCPHSQISVPSLSLPIVSFSCGVVIPTSNILIILTNYQPQLWHGQPQLHHPYSQPQLQPHLHQQSTQPPPSPPPPSLIGYPTSTITDRPPHLHHHLQSTTPPPSLIGYPTPTITYRLPHLRHHS